MKSAELRVLSAELKDRPQERGIKFLSGQKISHTRGSAPTEYLSITQHSTLDFVIPVAF
ncbi:hypothetical protein [Nostoc sp. 106C]|uniref:hypothetical protein n=1 Tax=Nostoc sp. 106C TaxID=1932667 RepID=UPI001AA1A402|nr:hypothetical protein [Nostoc sp. 106C]